MAGCEISGVRGIDDDALSITDCGVLHNVATDSNRSSLKNLTATDMQ